MILIDNSKSEYNSNSHFYYKCNYHVVFCPKYRRSVLTLEIANRMKDLFYSICEKCNSKIIEIEILEDHVHILLECDPSFGISKLIRNLKGKSSKILREEFPSLKKRLPCLWTRSSFISTVGTVSLKTVKEYIKNQKGK